MQVSHKGIAAIVAHEGIVPAPYLDSVGVWTYGIGHTAAAGHPIPAKMGRGVPADLDAELSDVFDVFRRDLESYSDAVRRAVKVPMAQHEFDAAVSFHYNTGAIARASWVKHWNAGNRSAAVKAFMNWSKPKEIIPRRRQERDLFAHGIYPKSAATVWGVTASGRVSWRPIRTLNQSDILAHLAPIAPPPAPEQPTTAPTPATGFAAALRAFFAAIFGKGKA